jgi:Pyruvate/2-oxoacid:ferredoxin oxidoreductase delta subunit
MRSGTPPFGRIMARLAEEYPQGFPENECWPWPGSKGSHGYGQVFDQGQPVLVHRVIFVEKHGPIPDGHVVDHTCHNEDVSCPGGKTCWHRPCCNWDHLEAVTRKTNGNRADEPRQRKSYAPECPNGHLYTPENTAYAHQRKKNGVYYWRKYCKQCNRDRVKRSKGKS